MSGTVPGSDLEATVKNIAGSVSGLERALSSSTDTLFQNLRTSLATMGELNSILEEFLLASLQVKFRPTGAGTAEVRVVSRAPHAIEVEAEATAEGERVVGKAVVVPGGRLALGVRVSVAERAAGLLLPVELHLLSPGTGRRLTKRLVLAWPLLWLLPVHPLPSPSQPSQPSEGEGESVEVRARGLRVLLGLGDVASVEAGCWAVGGARLVVAPGPSLATVTARLTAPPALATLLADLAAL